jgi:hypothetical protein
MANTVMPSAVAGSAQQAWGSQGGSRGGGGRGRWLRRHGVRLLVAMLLVAAGAVVAAWLVASADPRSLVLVTARPVAAGAVVSAGDVRAARVAVDESLHPIRAAQRGEVVGQVAALPLPADALITPQMLGVSRWPPAGEALVAVPVKQGQYPPSVQPGSAVEMVFAAGPNSGSGPSTGTASAAAPQEVDGVVVSVSAGAARDGSAVVELELPVDGARQIAAASSVVLLAVAPGR